MRIRSAVPLLVALLLPPAAWAQQPSDSLVAMRARAVARLKPRAHIRVTTPATGRVAGRFRGVIGDTLLLDVRHQVSAIPVAAIDTLWVRGRRTTVGAVIGGIFGAATTGSLFYVIGQIFCGMQGGEDCSTGALTALGAIGGGVGGAFWGGAVGSLFGHWVLQPIADSR